MKKKEFTYPHKIECAIRSLSHGSAACQKLATFLTEQQKPDFDAQDHLFVEAAEEFKKALKWTERATQNP